MVDVGNKPDTERQAKARGQVKMSREAYDLVREGQGPKGDVFTVAKIAGVLAAKNTAGLIPLCHPLALSFVDVTFRFRDRERIVEITSTAKTKGPTGVEMEALTAAVVTALTVYDMCKAADRGMVLGEIRLEHKSGGKSGTYERAR